MDTAAGAVYVSDSRIYANSNSQCSDTSVSMFVILIDKAITNIGIHFQYKRLLDPKKLRRISNRYIKYIEECQ